MNAEDKMGRAILLFLLAAVAAGVAATSVIALLIVGIVKLLVKIFGG